MLYQEIGFDQLGKPIFIGPYNMMQTGSLPVNALLLVSNQWTNGVGMHRQNSQILGPEDEVLIESDVVDFFLKDALAAHRVDHRMGVTFTSEGRYKIRVLLNDRAAIEYYFVVRLLQPPA